MPKQVVPFTGFDQVGLIRDIPPVALPPNAFSDVRNVRFKDGAVRKMEGEVNIFPNLFDNGALSYDGSVLKYIVWWPNPNIIDNNQGYYLIIREETVTDPASGPSQRDVAYLALPGSNGDSATFVQKGTFTPDTQANWQHTFFQGGFALVINNGLDAPHYILDSDGNESLSAVPDFAPLPGWESYNINETVTSDTYSEALNERQFSIGSPVNFTNFQVTASVTRGNTVTEYSWNAAGPAISEGSPVPDVVYRITNNVAEISFPPLVGDDDTRLANGDQVLIRVSSRNPTVVRAGVLRAFGDFLVAGDLVEYDQTSVLANPTDPGMWTILRNLAGIVRTSDVAAPGQIPTNWNPFSAGVSTADEFVLTATGVVQDMAELQGNFYIYSNTSISVMRQTGNAVVPLSVTPLTDAYGAQTTEAVLEFDGKHFVIGSQDIYLFGGHPGSIQSISDQKVRRYFFDRLNPLHNQRLFTIRYAQRDEIWICYPTTGSIQGECDEALIWNYRNNTWTIRELTSAVAGDVGPVPGGGLPTSASTFQGNTGDNQEIQSGIVEQQAIQFPANQMQIIEGHAGTASVYNVNVQGLLPFISNAASFELVFGNLFDTGPTFGEEDVDFQTPPVEVTIQLLESSDPAAAVTIPLPRFLTTDKQWTAMETYFAGNGQVGDPDYYPGQRVLDMDAPMGGTLTVYQVSNGFGDGSVPGSFYRPNEDGPFYDNPEVSSFVYQDTIDVDDVHPRDLIEGATYGFVPGDGGTGNAITAAEARWISLGAAATQRRDIEDVVRIFQDTLQANATFNQFFNAIENDNTDNILIVEALRSSGVDGFPTFGGVSIEFSFPDINNTADNPPQDDNGGNITDLIIRPNVDTTVTQADAVVMNFSVRSRTYTPFDPENPTTTGRYVSDSTAPVVDTITVAFNGNFSGSMINENVATLVRDAFTRDPTGFWIVAGTGADVIVTSRSRANYELSLDLVAPPDIGIARQNFIITATTVGELPVDGSTGAIPQELPYFRVTPAGGADERVPAFFQPVSIRDTTTDRGEILNAILTQAITTYQNWSIGGVVGDIVTLQTADDREARDIPASLRLAQRPVTGTWIVEAVAPGNTINLGITSPTPAIATSMETQAGQFSLSATPSYMGILVSNPTITGGLEMLLLEAGDPTGITAAAAVTQWLSSIRAAIPRISVVQRTGGFFLQPANYDNLANFVLEVRINDTPQNAHWIEQIVTMNTNPENTMQTGIQLNSASNIPLFINGSQEDDVYDMNQIPTDPNSDAYRIAGGPLKVAQNGTTGMSTTATLRLVNDTTLIFDIFRPWPRDEVNQNLEYPLIATGLLDQDGGGIFRRLNKVVGADIGWSRPTYDFSMRTTTEDTTNFRETIDGGLGTDGVYFGDDFPQPYPSYYERVQLTLTPEFDTEQLTSIALWADGSTPQFLRGVDQHNQLDVRISTTNYPGEVTTLDPLPTTQSTNSNLFNVSADYKIDMRLHGRFINYRVTDATPIPANSEGINPSREAEWRVSGMQADIMKGGTR